MSVESIASHREKRGLSQLELARKAGIARPQISLYETGKANPSVRNLRKIADALSVTLSEIALNDGMA